jgi:hypothetical protein
MICRRCQGLVIKDSQALGYSGTLCGCQKPDVPESNHGWVCTLCGVSNSPTSITCMCSQFKTIKVFNVNEDSTNETEDLLHTIVRNLPGWEHMLVWSDIIGTFLYKSHIKNKPKSDWNPLTSNEDAAWLEAHLEINIEWNLYKDDHVYATIVEHNLTCSEPYRTDKNVARRLATTRVAAVYYSKLEIERIT